MFVIARAELAAALADSAIDPMVEFSTEMTAFAAAVLADLTADCTHVVFADHECGSDPGLDFSESHTEHAELVPGMPETDNGYYGVTRMRHPYDAEAPVIYYCYMAGSSGQSACGFMLIPAKMLP